LPTAEPRLVLTCEHGGNRVPKELGGLFARHRGVLASHRGWDPGALSVARSLARAMQAPLIAATTTRLLVDLNRSASNPRVFSTFTRILSRAERERLLKRYHEPHWEKVRAAIAASRGRVVHVAIHSFVPSLERRPRRFAIGILYDPKRAQERRFAIQLQQHLREHFPKACIRRNAPYRGNSDGLTTALRREYPERRYLGLELELNQSLIASRTQRRDLVEGLEASLKSVVLADSLS
jgi:predicted N-formylglutamate amidohydrolase